MGSEAYVEVVKDRRGYKLLIDPKRGLSVETIIRADDSAATIAQKLYMLGDHLASGHTNDIEDA